MAVPRAPRYAHLVGLTALSGVIAACGAASKSAGPLQSVGTSCASSATVTLAVLQSTTIDCSNGGDGFTLAGNGATYLLVPEFPVGDVNYASQTFALSKLGGPRDLPSVVGHPAVFAGAAGRTPFLNHQQATFDLRLRAADRRRVSSATSIARSITAAGVPRPPATVAARTGPPAIRTFQVVADSTGSTFKTSVAQLAYVGTNVYVYLDTTAPKAPNGFDTAQLQQFGRYADQLLYPLDLNTFGPPTDIDGNGHVIMLLTPIVNALTPTGECATDGFVAGFFDGLDLSPSEPHSNAAEIFYQMVPDSASQFSCQHKVSEVLSITPGTFLHELQHMINFGQHVLIHGGSPEEGWLDEGESIVATELGSRYYEAKYPPGTGRTDPTQLFPDSAEPFISEQLFDSYNFLTAPDTQSLTLHNDSQGGLDWRGGDWLLLRYVGDQFDSTVYARLDQSNLTGTTNLAHATGIPFAQMFAGFGMAAYTDSLPGIPRSSIPPADRFVSRNLRQIYQRLYADCATMSGCGEGITAPFPITVQTLSPTTTLSGSMVPGTMAFYQLTTPAGSATVGIAFGQSASGGSFPSTLQAQVGVFRIK